MGAEITERIEVATLDGAVSTTLTSAAGLMVEDPQVAVATVDPDARVEAPAIVGHGAVIGAGARVVGSVLGPDSIVGPGARVMRSVVHAGGLGGFVMRPGVTARWLW